MCPVTLALCSVTLALPACAVLQLHDHNSLFTIHNCACTSLHMARGHSPLRLAPRSHASGALTAEEWTRQSIRFLVAFWLSRLLPTLASDASVVCCFTLLLYSFLRSPLLPVSFAAPQPGKYGWLALGSSISLGYGQVASLHSQLLWVTTLLAPSHFRNSLLAFLLTTRPSL